MLILENCKLRRKRFHQCELPHHYLSFEERKSWFFFIFEFVVVNFSKDIRSSLDLTPRRCTHSLV